MWGVKGHSVWIRVVTPNWNQRMCPGGVSDMVSDKDREQLGRAVELVLAVIERHRSEDLRMLSLFNAAVQDIRVGERYLGATGSGLETRK